MIYLVLYTFGVLITPSLTHLHRDSDTGLNTFQMITNHGYTCENHQITTEDGYILTYQRIPNPSKKPVLLMHGSGSCSADYVSMGPERGLGYILADLGYDVWLANARGNFWSRNHTSLDVVKNAKEFYDFSWHEVGYYDLPAAIDYILGVNGGDGVYFVGHSVGTTVFLVMASTRPEYNEKVKLASLMAPVAYIEHSSNQLLVLMSQYIDELKVLLDTIGIYDVPFVEQIQKVATTLCPELLFSFCKDLVFQIVGTDDEEFDQQKVGVIFSNLPSNSGMKFFYHLGQQIKNGGFSQYDYGTTKNLEKYGSEKPPAYDLSKITAPVALYYGKNDLVVNSKDVASLVDKLPNLVENYEVPYEKFNHIDFLWAIDAKKFVYDEIIRVMKLLEG